MPGDLHTHTNFSDGSSDIELLPKLAARAGLTHLAVSDHDTTLSAEYAYGHPVVQGVRMIPAVELTGFDVARGRRVHLLCYWPKLTPALKEFCALMAARRNAATEKSMEELEALYPQFCREEAKAFSRRSSVTYKTHLIRLLFEYGYTDGIYKELYRELFGAGRGRVLHDPAYEPVQAVLELARGTGGVVVLAHPSVYSSMELAAQLAAQGAIDGVEIDHPRNTSQDKAALHELARQYGLIVTGGTDFHGMHMSKPTPLGAMTTRDEMLARIEALAQSRGGAPQGEGA